MTTIRKCAAAGFAMAFAAVCCIAVAQDDLDDLLKDLGDEAANAAKTNAQAAPAAEPAAADPAPAAKSAEEQKLLKELDENPAVATTPAPAAEPPVAETPAPAADVPAVAETPAVAEPAPAAEQPAPVAEQPAPSPLADVASAASAASAPAAAGEDAEFLSNLRTNERLRRRSLDVQARREVAIARDFMEEGDYEEAVRYYGLALKRLNDSQTTKNLQKECRQGIAEGLYRAALEEDSAGRRAKAISYMEKALDMRHPRAARYLDKWSGQTETPDAVALSGDFKGRLNDPEFRESRDSIRRHLRRGRQFLAVRDMKRALEECEIVLRNDPYNQDAIRLRRAIQRKRQTILEQERVQAREGMIADVDEAWRPVYAVNASKLTETASETVKTQTGEDPERTIEQEIEKRMKEMRLPTISFKPPATIMDAVDYFRTASKDYDRPDIPIEKRGFNFVLKTPQGAIKNVAAKEGGDEDSGFGSQDDAAAQPANGLDPIPTITASDITFYEALKLVCDSVDYKFIVRGPVVMVMHKDMSTAELLSRKYDVLEAFLDRMTATSGEVKEQMKSQGSGFGGSARRNNAEDDGEENQERDWKATFKQMGVNWPEGSSIKFFKTLGKLYVRNTRENLAELEKVLQEMGSQPKLIEIEARFVEVEQQDLNSLGFEWILNSDYSLTDVAGLGKALGLQGGTWGRETTSSKTSYSTENVETQYRERIANTGKWGNMSYDPSSEKITSTSSFTSERTLTPTTPGSSWIRNSDGPRNIGINAFGGTSDQQNGNRYLSTTSNHISGDSKSTNDQFMRVNAFLGEADLSMILHMLSQRSDTDLLSAPKVVTKSGENAVIKVVTEYIYPTDYDVQLQSSSSGGSYSSSGSSSAILAVVEPQSFQTREVGVILDVTPTYSEANGGTIDLDLKPSVVDEPTWYNYGMKIPFSGNSSVQSFEGLADIPIRAVEAITTLGGTLSSEDIQSYSDAIMSSSLTAMSSASGAGNMTWYEAPMNQPFFHVRSIDSKVSITPGATVVMGGLITESRKAMDDKIPFLGDLPYIGRLFRSHAEQTIKRNLLIFVTGRLITPAGRELQIGDTAADESEVKSAPEE